MKRRKFLQAALVASPLVATAKLQSKAKRNTKGFKVDAGVGRFHGHIQLKGNNILDLKISGKDSNGDLAMFQGTHRGGTPLHIHYFQDEIFFVLEGEYLFKVGEERYKMKAGDTIFLPRNIPHAFVPTTELGKMIVMLQPAGRIEEFFLASASLPENSTPADWAEIIENYDMKVVGPPIKAE